MKGRRKAAAVGISSISVQVLGMNRLKNFQANCDIEEWKLK